MAALLLLLGWLGAEPHALQDHAAICELNHYYGDTGEHVFDQVIWSDWCGDHWEVRDWRLSKNIDVQAKACTWWDNGILRKVTADQFRESWTQYDVELEQRQEIPKEDRRGLTPHKGR